MTDHVYVPTDVVALVLGFLQERGVEADSTIPRDDVTPGTVRVTRTGGGLINSRPQDRAQILIEVWEQNQPRAFRFASYLYALFAVVNDDPQAKFMPTSGVVVYAVDPDIPVQNPDEYAPELDRHQFNVSITVGMEVAEVADFATSEV